LAHRALINYCIMGNKHPNKVQPARVEPVSNCGPGWVEFKDHDGNTVFFHPQKRMYSSLEHGDWYTQSRRDLLVSRHHELHEDRIWSSMRRQKLRDMGHITSDSSIEC
jgi:hypothetical protein